MARQDEAGGRRFALPTIEVVPAQLIAGPAAGGPSSSRLFTVALVVALAASAGIAMVVDGFSGKAVYASVAQAPQTCPCRFWPSCRRPILPAARAAAGV